MEAIFANPGLYHIAEIICKNLEPNSFQRLVSTCKSTQNFSAAISKRWLKKCQEKGLCLDETWTSTLEVLQKSKYQWNLGIIFQRLNCENSTKVFKTKFHPLAIAAKCGQVTIVKVLLRSLYHDKIGPKYDKFYKDILERLMGKNEKPQTFKAFKIVLGNWLHHSTNILRYGKVHKSNGINKLMPTAYLKGSKEIKEILHLLLNSPDSFGHTPMHFYAFHGYAKESIEMVKFAADICQKPNRQDQFGTTPMHIAVANGHFEIVKALMLNWNNKDAKNNENKTVFDIAKEKGNQEIISLIQKHDYVVSKKMEKSFKEINLPAKVFLWSGEHIKNSNKS